MALKQLKLVFDHRKYPSSPGHALRDTSKRAAGAVRGRKLETRTRIVALLRARPMTADEIAEYLGEDRLYIRPRMTELVVTEQIEDSNVRRFNISGRSAIVWQLK